VKKYELLDKTYKSNLPSRAKQLMFYFINRANAEGTCFPSVGTIASDCGISERTIQRTMKVLLKEGFVIKENRYRDNGGQSSNLYKLQIKTEKNIGNESNSNENIIKEQKSELKEEKNDNFESIETVTFNDYIEANEIKEKNMSSEKNTVFNILIKKIEQNGNLKIKPRCHPVFFQRGTQRFKICEAVTSTIFLRHGVGDILYPP